MGKPKKKYDDEELVLDIANGVMTYRQIGAKHGLAKGSIGRIARGECRPELQTRIDAATWGMHEQARRMGARLASAAMTCLGKIIADDSTAGHETRRKAAVDILKFVFGDVSGSGVVAPPRQSAAEVGFADLSPAEQEAEVAALRKRLGKT